MALTCFDLLSFFATSTDISTIVTVVITREQLSLMGGSHTLLQLAEGLVDFFDLDWSQILTVCNEGLCIVATALIDMLQDHHGQVSELFVLL